MYEKIRERRGFPQGLHRLRARTLHGGLARVPTPARRRQIWYRSSLLHRRHLPETREIQRSRTDSRPLHHHPAGKRPRKRAETHPRRSLLRTGTAGRRLGRTGNLCADSREARTQRALPARHVLLPRACFPACLRHAGTRHRPTRRPGTERLPAQGACLPRTAGQTSGTDVLRTGLDDGLRPGCEGRGALQLRPLHPRDLLFTLCRVGHGVRTVPERVSSLSL